MAIKKCKECGKEVSTKANQCPNCGVKNPTQSLTKKLISVILGLLLIGWFCSMLGGEENPSTSQADGFSELSLNVREGPSTDYETITALEAGEKVRFLDDSLGWKKVELIEREGYETGWASGKYLSDISQFNEWENNQENDEVASSNQSNTQTNRQNIDWGPVKNAIQQSRESGFLTRIERVERTYYVNPLIWRSIDAQTKENAVKTFARYMGYLNDMDQAVGIYVKDSQSGKTIAEYGVFSGVEIK